jgi:hypothetical protein
MVCLSIVRLNPEQQKIVCHFQSNTLVSAAPRVRFHAVSLLRSHTQLNREIRNKSWTWIANWADALRRDRYSESCQEI